MIGLLLLAQFALWEPSVPPVQHQGYWQSCMLEDGSYAERVQEHWERGHFVYELHLGPKDEFALYNHVVDGPDHVHASVENLLGRDYRVGDDGLTKRIWRVPSLHLEIEVRQAGGSDPACLSYWVQIRRSA